MHDLQGVSENVHARWSLVGAAFRSLWDDVHSEGSWPKALVNQHMDAQVGFVMVA